MNNDTKPEQIELEGWTFRVQYPHNNAGRQRLMLLLHGYQGNENVMWVLTKPLLKDYYLLAPRAPKKVGDGQFSWHEIAPQWPGMDVFQNLTGQLLTRVDQWLERESIQHRTFDVMGFSQGAVMAYALALLHPERTQRVAALAGFIPQAWQSEPKEGALAGKAFFVAHGTQDEIIPIAKARQAADWLTENGAQVTFCEAEIGHKLSANCFNGLGEFFD